MVSYIILFMDFAILGVQYDKTQTLRKGSAKAPELIRRIFPKMETFVNGVDLSEHFIEDLDNIKPNTHNELINQVYLKLSECGKFPIIIGGEHTVSLAGVKATRPLTFVSIDAHPDCEDSDGHNGVTRRIADVVGKHNTYLYGIRAVSKAEDEYMKENKIKTASLEELKKLKQVYLSIDLDAIDPAVIRNVGNPEPDGMTFAEIVDEIRILAPNLVAIDFVEYTPAGCSAVEIDTILVGKLIYAAMAEIAKAKESKN